MSPSNGIFGFFFTVGICLMTKKLVSTQSRAPLLRSFWIVLMYTTWWLPSAFCSRLWSSMGIFAATLKRLLNDPLAFLMFPGLFWDSQTPWLSKDEWRTSLLHGEVCILSLVFQKCPRNGLWSLRYLHSVGSLQSSVCLVVNTLISRWSSPDL